MSLVDTLCVGMDKKLRAQFAMSVRYDATVVQSTKGGTGNRQCWYGSRDPSESAHVSKCRTQMERERYESRNFMTVIISIR